ncbi:DUF7550 family protein [Haloarchaeobius sp. HRN-SO-5]|uniref:DUF7550 family protein n=1 Tax=Haloarchaeobius sp. HRN-SO-5 TaxID=3446118 RepID=UPI003EBE15E0
MSDETEDGDQHDSHESSHLEGHAETHSERVTSPMQDFGMDKVGIGFVVLLVGVAVTAAVPLLLV